MDDHTLLSQLSSNDCYFKWLLCWALISPSVKCTEQVVVKIQWDNEYENNLWAVRQKENISYIPMGVLLLLFSILKEKFIVK